MAAAKAEDLDVSASVAAEHLLFIDADADGYDTLMRAEPPYRTAADRSALVDGVNDRTIDAVVSGHSPVPPQAKDLPFDEAPPGVAALETCAAIVLGHPDIDLETALDALAWRPAELAGATHLGGGAIEPGQPANLVVLDLDRPWTLAERGSVSMARNTPHRHLPDERDGDRDGHRRSPGRGRRRTARRCRYRRCALCRNDPMTPAQDTPAGPAPGALVLADGTTFEGEMIGAPLGADSSDTAGIASGEVVFNTVMTGYQEVITDPSYAGQIIAFTYPHIGNYGTTPTDAESRRPFCRGVVIRDLARRRSNWRSDASLDAFLARHGIAGIAGVDTRRLTRHVRDYGAMPWRIRAQPPTTTR